jgi:anti-sigma regulatory factor (Ser/Thr protein kinase)
MDTRFTRLKLPARVESVRAFHEFVREGAEEAGLTSAQLDKLDLVLEEILVNIAKYAYESGTGEVEVAYVAEGSELLVEITDSGRSFNPLEAAPPDLALGLADRPVGGLGVLLVKQIVGALGYRRKGMQNIVSFRFPAPDSDGT